jgi:hypothetical protein
MQISPWPVGQTYPPLQAQLRLTDGTIVAALATATLTLIIRAVPSGVDTNGTGSFGAVDMTTGMVTYTWSTADVATAGTYQLLIKAVYVGGAITKFGPVEFQIVTV